MPKPRFKRAPIKALRPTQLTVGLLEVEVKRRRLEALRPDAREAFLEAHPMPVVIGPAGRLYITDHHHLARALHDEGVEDILVTIIGDLSMVERDAFWGVMDNKRWVYPYDAKGERRHFKDLPKSITELKDDPFRSLAGELRRSGGFAKDTTPFSEFLWADFLRRRVERKRIEKSFASALEQALLLAKSFDADYLPGWCGASSVQSS